jgi:hypothetical protein
MGMQRRVARVVGCAAVAGGLMLVAASCVTNSGTFIATAGPGSYLEVVDTDGNPNPQSYLDIGNIACDDGVDNDLDGAVDSADGQCDGDHDANERLAGFQKRIPTTVPFEVEPSGHISIDPKKLSIQPVEHCVPGTGGTVWCLAVTLHGSGPALDGKIQGRHVELPIPITIKFDALSGFPGLDPACETGHITAPFTGDDYDEATGRVTLHVEGQVVPRLTNCGDWTEGLNAVLGLPALGRSTLVGTFLDEHGHPITQVP